MKVIHCADVHIGSPLMGVANSNARRHELLKAFEQMVNYAYNVGAEAVVIAGDLLDKEGVTTNELSSLASVMARYPIQYFIVAGNHSGQGDYDRLQRLASKNVHFFGKEWKGFSVADVGIYGMELDGNDSERWSNARIDSGKKFNVVVLHADLENTVYGEVDVNWLVSNNVNYVALGHRHAFEHKKAQNTHFVYSGVLEIRGFDERQDSGFVLIDTDTGKIAHVSQAIRRVSDVEVDCNGVEDDIQLKQRVDAALRTVDVNNYINVTLKGYTEGRVHADRIKQDLKGRFFALRVKDETKIRLDLSKLPESTIAGRFVRVVKNNADGDIADDILRLGLSALQGEDLE